jgi:thiamine pyrophosphokinase
MRTTFVVAGGDAPSLSVCDDLPAPELVVAADSGLHHALAAGWKVDVVVGDLDSVGADELARAVAAGVVVERHPVAKDATDLELALATARRRGSDRIVVLGVDGGRLDHFLANTLLLAAPELADAQVEARIGDADVLVVRDQAELRGSPGELCSLLPVGGPARGIRTNGLRYPLRGEDLAPGSTRGVSNELVEPVAVVTLEDGVLLAVLPHARRAWA